MSGEASRPGALFRVKGVLRVSGRGPVLAGEIVGGTIRPGMEVVGRVGRAWPIVEVSFLDPQGDIALVLEAQAAVADVERSVPIGDVFEVRETV